MKVNEELDIIDLDSQEDNHIVSLLDHSEKHGLLKLYMMNKQAEVSHRYGDN